MSSRWMTCPWHPLILRRVATMERRRDLSSLQSTKRGCRRFKLYQEVKHCWSVRTQFSRISEPPHKWTFLGKPRDVYSLKNARGNEGWSIIVKVTHSLWMLTTQLPSMPCTWCPPTILVLMCTKHDVLVSEHKGRSAFPIHSHYSM